MRSLICPQASSSTSLFALVDFSEKVTGDRGNSEKTKEDDISRRVQIYFELESVLYLFKGTVRNERSV